MKYMEHMLLITVNAVVAGLLKYKYSILPSDRL